MLNVARLGTCGYREGLALQAGLVEARAAGRTGDWLLYPDHPPVLTVGRNPSPGSLIADRASLERAGIELFEVARGGDITWHGPGQLVGYLIVDLTPRDRDLHRFLRDIEQGLNLIVAVRAVRSRRGPSEELNNTKNDRTVNDKMGKTRDTVTACLVDETDNGDAAEKQKSAVEHLFVACRPLRAVGFTTVHNPSVVRRRG